MQLNNFLPRRSTVLCSALLCALVCIFYPTAARAESEPNDSIAEAIPIGIGLANAEKNATLNSTTDEDYYKFSAVAGRTYVIETYGIQGTGTSGTGLWLYNDSGTRITEDQYGQQGTGNADARVVYKFTASATYFIRVRRQISGDWQGTYSLRILPRHDEPNAAWDAANDNEPNNALALANEINGGLANAQTHQLFDTSNFVTNGTDRDWYHFTPVANRTYVIETYGIQSTGTSGTGLWLYNSSGSPIADDAYGQRGVGDADARIVHKFTTNEIHYIRVRRQISGDWQGTYSIRVLPKHSEPGAAWDARNDDEPNSAFDLANELKIGLGNAQTHELFDTSNFVTNGSNQDWYHFTPQANRAYVIETYNMQGTGTSGTGLWLFNSSGSLIDDDAYGQHGTGNADARIVYKATGDDTHYIRVRKQISGDWKGTYSIRILPKHDESGAAWDATDDDEPNDVRVLANTIQIGANNAQTHKLFDHTNFITNDSDRDWYNFNAQAGQKVIIETFNVQASGRATGLWLYDASGTELADDASGNSDGEARIAFTFTSSGIYYVRVKDADFRQWTGSYSLRICDTSCVQPVFLPDIRR